MAKGSSQRVATVRRKTAETDIRLAINLDGRGKSKVATGIRFFDHMMDLLAQLHARGMAILIRDQSRFGLLRTCC